MLKYESLMILLAFCFSRGAMTEVAPRRAGSGTSSMCTYVGRCSCSCTPESDPASDFEYYSPRCVYEDLCSAGFSTSKCFDDCKAQLVESCSEGYRPSEPACSLPISIWVGS